MITLLDRMVDEGFVAGKYRRIACIAEQPGALLDQLEEWRPPELAPWLRARDL